MGPLSQSQRLRIVCLRGDLRFLEAFDRVSQAETSAGGIEPEPA